ncbi:MAG: pyridoxal-5'-phosphate-dependent protein subunit beta [Deltaproteobacteria bacterium CSP1-8]|nr:MAG: pyridoxal-5'-phosphate-dependent protein subunit beta [Deltaproteobacteria bacterium CSP1-8]
MDLSRKVFDDVSQMIGSPGNPTPLLRLRRLPLRGSGEILAKLEWMNPFGSIKDRTAKFLLEGLQRDGRIAGKRIVEPTSGNTGIALAALSNIIGLPCTITIPSGAPEEKIALLRLLGAEVWPTPDDLCPVDHPKDGAIALARTFVTSEATRDRYVMPNQYENPDNVRAHYETTGPEIWEQTEGKVTHFFAGYGTCGTITGVAKYLKEKKPDVQVVAIEPERGHRLSGLKNFEESRTPGILDRSLVDKTVRVSDTHAYRTTIRLAREESLLAGPSTGAIVWAALQENLPPGTVSVCISPDNAFKYVSFLAEYVAGDGVPEVSLTA